MSLQVHTLRMLGLCMSKYSDWMIQQDKDFIEEVCGDRVPCEKFKDYNFKRVTLEELEQLDDKFINKESETLN